MSKQLEETVVNEIEAYDLVIDVNSLSNITKGWSINISEKGMKNYKEKSSKKSCVVGVVGNKNKGKSFLLTKLAKIQLPSGHSLTTKGLSVKYPEIEQQNIVLLDTAGLETPITGSTEVYDLDKELKAQMALTQDEFEASIKEIEDEKAKEDKVKEHEENLKREIISKFTTDKQITEYFLQTFILQESNILIFLVEQLTYADQKLLNRVKKECKGKKLFVVHNLYTLNTKEEVEQYIENTLLKSLTFKLKKIKIAEFDEETKKEESKKEDVNQYFWAEEYIQNKSNDEEDDTDDDDKREIIHYIMANDKSEAGKYYNAVTIKCLQNQIKTFSNTDVFPIQDRLVRYFVKKSGDLIDGLRIKKDDMSTENKKISLKGNDEEPQAITLKKCLIDELGFSKFQGSLFTPCYKHYINEDKTRFIIEIEMPGTAKHLHFNLKIDKNGNYLFMFTGKKEFIIPSDNILTLNTIDKGKFELVIKVPMSDINLKDSKIKDKKRENGIHTVEFELKPPTKIEEDEYEEEPIANNNEDEEEES